MPVIQMLLLKVGRPQPGIYLCFILENVDQDVYNPTSMKKDSGKNDISDVEFCTKMVYKNFTLLDILFVGCFK
jgi:hypothetical protein